MCPSSYSTGAVVPKSIGSSEMHLVFAGNIDDFNDSNRNIRDIVEGLIKSGVHVHIYWKVDPYCIKSPFYHFVGYLDAKSLVKEISKYDYGVVAYALTDSTARRAAYAPAKAFDYLAAGLPIITFSYLKGLSELVNEHGVGVVFKDHADMMNRVGSLKNRSFSIDTGYFNIANDVDVLMSMYREISHRGG
jgi:hypothetical protein